MTTGITCFIGNLLLGSVKGDKGTEWIFDNMLYGKCQNIEAHENTEPSLFSLNLASLSPIRPVLLWTVQQTVVIIFGLYNSWTLLFPSDL